MKKQNMLIGAKVILDFGNLWQSVRPEFKEMALAEAKEQNKHYFGRRGIVIDYVQDEQKVLVRLDDDGTTDWHYRGSAKIEELPKNETDALLKEILQAIKSLK